MATQIFLLPLGKQFLYAAGKSEGPHATPHCPIIVGLAKGEASSPIGGHTVTDDPVLSLALSLAPGTTHQEHSMDMQPQGNRHCWPSLLTPAASFFFSVWALEFQIKCPSPTAKNRSN